MKYIQIIAAAAFMLAAGTDTLAQSKTGNSQTKSNTFSSGKTAKQADKEVTNVSQTREYELEKENGYYQMSGERNWGTNAQLNGFPYPVIMPSLHPEQSIDTSGHQIQSGLYDGKGNASGEGTPVRKLVDQEERARKMPLNSEEERRKNKRSN